MDNKRRRKTPSTPSKTPKRLPKRKRTAQTSISAKRALSTSSSPAIELRQRELKLYKSGQAKCIVGCDEAGRGPLVGLNPFLYLPQLLLTRTNFSLFFFALLLIDVHRHISCRHIVLSSSSLSSSSISSSSLLSLINISINTALTRPTVSFGRQVL